jgi:hypothetical protein
MQFLEVDRSVFRQALAKTSFYADWKKPSSAKKLGFNSRKRPESWGEQDGTRAHRRDKYRTPGTGFRMA